jgi:hypothetical protein
MSSGPRLAPLTQRGVALAVITLCVGVLVYLLWPIHRLVLQAVALLVFLLGFRFCPPLTRWLARMPALHRLSFFLLMGAVVVGHFSLTTYRYYPFVAWEIFSGVSEKDSVLCRELIGTTEQGRPVRLLVEQLFPSIIQFDLPPAGEDQKIEKLVHVLARAYNAHHPSDPVSHVDLMLMAVDLHPSPGESRPEPSCELLQRYEISSAR